MSVFGSHQGRLTLARLVSLDHSDCRTILVRSHIMLSHATEPSQGSVAWDKYYVLEYDLVYLGASDHNFIFNV